MEKISNIENWNSQTYEFFFMHSKFFGKFLSFMAAFKISPFSRSNI